MRKNWFISFLFIFLLISCRDEEEIELSYPKVSTNAVSEISSTGAMFSGIIEPSKLSGVLEYGFVWGQDEELLPANSFTIKFGKPTESEPSVKIKSTLIAQKIYYVRFYIKTDQKTIYGNLVNFKSLGSEGPIIRSLSPSFGVLGDTVTIQGRNFVDRAEKNKVKFGATETSILTLTDTTIVVTVPKDLSLESEHVNVSVSIEGNIANSPEPFTLLLSKIIPVIESITPHSIKACDTIIVVGKNFRPSSDNFQLIIQGNQEVNLIKATDDSLMFSIKLLPPIEFGFTVKTGRFELKSDLNFQELRPEFISTSPEAYVPGGIMTIKVKYFPKCLPIVVSAGGGAVEIIAMTEDEVRLKIPESCFYGEYPIGFGVSYNHYFLLTTPISSIPPQIFSVEPNHGVQNQEVAIHGDNFFDIQPYYTEFLDITSYSRTEIRGTVKEVYAPNGIDVVVNACGRSVTVERGFLYDPPVILDFNPKVITSVDQIITIEGSNFSPGVSNNVVTINNSTFSDEVVFQDVNHITIPASALIGDPLIETKFNSPISVQTLTGLTATSSTNLTVNHDGPWKKLNDFPGQARYEPVSFSISGRGYVGLGVGDRYFPTRDLWEFDPATEGWTRKKDFPDAYELETPDAIVANNKAYLLTHGVSLWEYDPVTNEWQQKAPFPGIDAEYKLFMGIGDKIYVGGGYYEGSSREFWEYNPLTNIWTRRADIIPVTEASSWSLFHEVNGKGFIYSTTSITIKLTYDPVTNVWSSEAINYLNVAPPWKIFEFNDYTIVSGVIDVLYKIIPGNNSFIPLPYAGPKRSAHAGFSIDKTGYIGLGIQGLILKDFWKFDPEKL
ncbi:MAG TPA: IPT/TIG domain-containing protein [Chryseolinea sp.]|nr:IPT/TIG domain-containing protein [Chryseolinea sp.]